MRFINITRILCARIVLLEMGQLAVVSVLAQTYYSVAFELQLPVFGNKTH